MLTPDREPPAGTTAKGRPQPHRRKGAIWFLLLLLALVLGLDALVGDRGAIALMRARREHRDLSAALAEARAENERLREEARRLREEPAAIEELARRNLGLIKPGEILFFVKDAQVPSPPQR